MKKRDQVKKATEKLNIPLFLVLTCGLFAFGIDQLIVINFQAVVDVAKLAQSIVTVIAGIWITSEFFKEFERKCCKKKAN